MVHLNQVAKMLMPVFHYEVPNKEIMGSESWQICGDELKIAASCDLYHTNVFFSPTTYSYLFSSSRSPNK